MDKDTQKYHIHQWRYIRGNPQSPEGQRCCEICDTWQQENTNKEDGSVTWDTFFV